jgi:hypothetical protein
MMAVLVSSACTPVFDWREVRPDGSGVAMLFPCKPDSRSRQVPLASGSVRMVLLSCSAGGATWALAHADLQDPTRIAASLAEMRGAAVANLRATAQRELPLLVAGATPNPSNQRLELHGRLSNGQPVIEQLALFTKGTRVFQATVLGERLDDEAVQTFFAGLKLHS